MTVKAIGPMLERLQGRPGERVLDVCCGPGYRAGTAAARGAVSVGIDIAPGMVDEARRRFPDAEFRVGDAEELNFPDAVFDAVICAFGLLHLPDPDKAIGEAFRVLIPGGLYVFSVWCEPGQALLLGLALKAPHCACRHDRSVAPSPAHVQIQRSRLGRSGNPGGRIPGCGSRRGADRVSGQFAKRGFRLVRQEHRKNDGPVPASDSRSSGQDKSRYRERRRGILGRRRDRDTLPGVGLARAEAVDALNGPASDRGARGERQTCEKAENAVGMRQRHRRMRSVALSTPLRIRACRSG